MIRIASDKTIALLTWLILLGSLSILSREELPVLAQAQFEKVNLNQAELEDLMQIPRLSFKTAQSILMERSRRGGFKALGELEDVSGVGPKTLEKIGNLFYCN